MRRIVGVYFMVVLFLAGCSSDNKQEVVYINQQENHKIEVVAEYLAIPWSIEKNKETFYLTERTGSIVKIENGVERQKVELQKNLATAAEAGLLGFVLAPDFQESNIAYAYYTYVDGSGQFNRIITLSLAGDVWREESVLIDKIPSGSYHHGGRLKIGPDGKLYATTGDASEASIAQDLNSLGGKILRMNLDGSIPDDNPFPNSYVYSYGHRNPQGITWSPDGTLYASEHGSSANDEINKIEAGENYGWPIIQGTEKKEGMVTPLFTSGKDLTWAPSGMDNYNGKLYVAALRGTAVLEFNLETGEYDKVITGFGRIRDVLVVENYLYFISNNSDGRGNPQNNDDKLYRIPLL
ncbi:PQQ-dependent sugar dehydrogenase [Sporosarcina highlanderae]|uniref:Sorbosone dehydrogenase family protein n=1 Tax=Sporosarcina highlanderae TaxID=3035916 RepID=A0ABT8JVA4_9BACL|nr:sorbosone dehydrogenase family protein [Sporosarcina highlanderae]MDN4608782.1 sorbosone dehydrogenase family protein [Sporosarcina highlanderae]